MLFLCVCVSFCNLCECAESFKIYPVINIIQPVSFGCTQLKRHFYFSRRLGSCYSFYTFKRYQFVV